MSARHRRLFATLLALGTLIVACVGDDAAQPESSASPVREPSVATLTPTAPSLARAPALGTPLLVELDDWDFTAGGARAFVRPIDPTTGRLLDDVAPLDVGRGTLAASPDGRMLAAANPRTGIVTFFDLMTQAELAALVAEPVGPLPYRALDRIQWSADGTRLLALRAHCSSGSCPHDVIDQLWEFAPATGAARIVADLDFRVADMVIAPDGEHLYVLADRFHDGPSGRRDEVASAVALARASGEVIGEVPLPALEIGSGPGVGPLEEASFVGWYGPALAQHGSRLYLAHADENRLTVVDLESMQVMRVVNLDETRSARSRFDSWLRSQFVRDASANAAQFWERSIELSPDGRLLLIAGRHVKTCEGDDEQSRCWSQRPSGLVVLDTATLEPVFRERAIEHFVITPDGRWLLGYATPYRERTYLEPAPPQWRRAYPVSGHGLTVIDLHSLEVAHRLWPGEPIPGRVMTSPNGRYAYARTYAPGIEDGDVRTCGDDCYRLHVVDVEHGESIAEQTLAQQQDLISPKWPAAPPAR